MTEEVFCTEVIDNYVEGNIPGARKDPRAGMVIKTPGIRAKNNTNTTIRFELLREYAQPARSLGVADNKSIRKPHFRQRFLKYEIKPGEECVIPEDAWFAVWQIACTHITCLHARQFCRNPEHHEWWQVVGGLGGFPLTRRRFADRVPVHPSLDVANSPPPVSAPADLAASIDAAVLAKFAARGAP